MDKFPNSTGHFRAEIEIFPEDKSPRNSPAYNGIRWGFVYADEFDALGLDGNTYRGLYSDVWPEFLNEHGNSLDATIALSGRLSSILHIAWPHMVAVHFERLEIGTRFYCMEGLKACAQGHVTTLSV